jgi:hypothetical protein
MDWWVVRGQNFGAQAQLWKRGILAASPDLNHGCAFQGSCWVGCFSRLSPKANGSFDGAAAGHVDATCPEIC